MSLTVVPPIKTVHELPPMGCVPPVTVTGGYFAFARVKENICLVQISLSTPMSALTTIDAKVYRHEFTTIFRLSETNTFHPADISIIEAIEDHHVRYEEENETVFMARELLDRMRKMTEKPRISRTRIGQYPTRCAPNRWG